MFGDMNPQNSIVIPGKKKTLKNHRLLDLSGDESQRAPPHLTLDNPKSRLMAAPEKSRKSHVESQKSHMICV